MNELWYWLQQRRWFAGKGRGGVLTGVQTLAELGRRPDCRVVCQVATVGYPDGGIEYYQLLTSYRPRPLPVGLIGAAGESGHAHDATQDPEAMALVLAALLGESGPHPGWVAHLDDRGPLSASLPVRVFGGEQSNTNVVIGDVAILKLFRRLEVGVNLDIEIHRALNKADVTSVAQLFGWASGDFTDAAGLLVSADLAMMVELLPDAEDGWQLACERVRSGVGFAEDAEALGRALAQVHRALAQEFGTRTLDGSRIAAGMRARLARAGQVAPALAPYRAQLEAGFERLSHTPVTVQRIHGDFHLGQTLHTAAGWRLIDFEGEPMKSMTERRAFDSPLRDMAGMLRSFSYAAASARRDAPAADWERRARDAFLGSAANPVLEGQNLVLLQAYEIDKAIYEVIYETRNRPDWVDIPLSSISALAATWTTQPPLD